MSREMMKDFVLSCCEHLNIKVDVSNDGIYDLLIPENLTHFFESDEYQISFEKVENPNVIYVTNESYFLHKLATVISATISGFCSGTIMIPLQRIANELQPLFPTCSIRVECREPYMDSVLMAWWKTTVKSYVVEELTRGLQFHFKSRKVSEVPFEVLSLFEKLQSNYVPGKLTQDNIQNAYQILIEEAKRQSIEFVEMKSHEWEKLLQQETTRIVNYYNTLIEENALAETSKQNMKPQEEIEFLRREMDLLIEQQKVKHQVDYNSLRLEVYLVMLVTKIIERGNLVIENEFGHVMYELDEKQHVTPKCAVTGSTHGPFIVTSDGSVVMTDHAVICNHCNRLRDKRYFYSCSLCQSSICIDCSVLSYSSQRPFCGLHTHECPSCEKIAGADEYKKCPECNQFYCSTCTTGHKCRLCMQLTPISRESPVLQEVLSLTNLQSMNYEMAAAGQRIYVQGKSMFLKQFLLIFDKNNNTTVEVIRHNWRGKQN